MSTAAHEPRRVGPRRAQSASGSKLTPRRNAPDTSEPSGTRSGGILPPSGSRRNALDTSEPSGARYDSDELPVLIRLPNLRELDPSETPAASPSAKEHRRIDSSSSHRQKAPRREASPASKRSFRQHVTNNKLVLGGVAGGILVVAMLLAFNGRESLPPAGQDAWASEDGGVLLEIPEASLSATNNSPPHFTY